MTAHADGLGRRGEARRGPLLPPGLLLDQTGTLSATERDALARRLQTIQACDRAQLVILLSGDIGGELLAACSLSVALVSISKAGFARMVLLAPTAPSVSTIS